VNKVWFLDAVRGEIDAYNMGWKKYLDARATDEARRRREKANAEKKASQLRMQAAKLGAKATKAAAAKQMIRRADAMIDNLDEVRIADKAARIKFPTPAACGKTPMFAKGLTKMYGSLEVFAGVDLAIDKGSRVVVLGYNGAGKTTLLKLLAGVERTDGEGGVVSGHGLKIGYFAQEHDTLDMDASVWENIRHAAPAAGEQELRSLLGVCSCPGAQREQPPGTRSGGERTRLALAGLVSSAANVLLLDEPTNNLDPISREQVLDALRTYEGAVVLVTHDPGAVEALEPERVIILPDGTEDLWSEEYMEIVELAGRRVESDGDVRACGPSNSPEGAQRVRATFAHITAELDCRPFGAVTPPCRRRGTPGPAARRRPWGAVRSRRAGWPCRAPRLR